VRSSGFLSPSQPLVLTRHPETVLYELYSQLNEKERIPKDGGYEAEGEVEASRGFFSSIRKMAAELTDTRVTGPVVPPPVYVGREKKAPAEEGRLIEV
jgi:hypothetical protein